MFTSQKIKILFTNLDYTLVILALPVRQAGCPESKKIDENQIPDSPAKAESPE